jgi:AcrR family transcriptional regulator
MDGKDQRPLGRRAQEQQREQKILRAAIEELARSDYGGMTVEGVALRAGVNKTTVYRKWETKAELMRAAFASIGEMYRIGPTAGDLRSDLRRIGQNIIAFSKTIEGRSLLRLFLLSHPEPELAEIAQNLHSRKFEELRQLIATAVTRGELARDADIALLLDVLWGALYSRLVLKNERVGTQLLESIVDIVMHGVCGSKASRRHVAPVSKAKSRRR